MRHLTLLIVFIFCGCSSIATYPPIESKVLLAPPNPANEPVPTIIGKVITYSHEHYGGMDSIVFNLPEGVNKKTYDIVSDLIENATPMSTTNELSYHIVELRVRGLSADADVLFPSASGNYGMATVRLKSSILGDWEVVNDRVWLIPVKTPPLPTYNTSDVELVEVESSDYDN
ncbi:MAG: hypothetical protein H8E83_04850 [Planctomycetes bacterium]|nr:hypothetical protein [Planctomycetota bacterium]